MLQIVFVKLVMSIKVKIILYVDNNVGLIQNMTTQMNTVQIKMEIRLHKLMEKLL